MRLAALIIVLYGCVHIAGAQVANEKPPRQEVSTSSKTNELRLTPYSYDNRLLLQYSKADLDTMRAFMPQKFKTVENYLLRSYVIDTANCNNCNLSEFTRKFKISDYEKFRKKKTPYVVRFKDGIRITILPVNSLAYFVPIFQFAKDE